MIYEYQCTECGDIFSKVRRVQDRKLPAHCDCGGEGRFGIFSAPVGHVQENLMYACPASGEKVTSWRQRKNIMAKFDLIDANETDQAGQMKERLKRKKERDKVANDYMNSMPKELRKQLKERGKVDGFHC